MSNHKEKFSVGDRVKFLRSHDRLQLTGTVINIHEDADCLDIERDVDGKIICIEGVETTHAADVTLLEKAPHGSESYGEMQARVERERLVRPQSDTSAATYTSITSTTPSPVVVEPEKKKESDGEESSEQKTKEVASAT